MGKRLPNFIMCLGVPLMILAACSDEEESEQSEQDSETQSADFEEAGNDEQEAEEEQEEIDQTPFEAIEPSEDAVPLEEHYDDEEKERPPDAWAFDESIERSVPLGEVLAEGKEDLSEGPLNDYRLVAFYGTPQSEYMGILGEYEPEEMMERLKEQTEAYSEIDPERPAVPTIELIATVAQRDPGPEGNYVSEPNTDMIDEYVELAEEHNALLMLDIQLGQTSVMEELQKIEPYLELPFVHLAIDTEYSVEEGEIPGEDLGEIDGGDIQEAIEYVDNMVEENNLPDKIVLVHQFANSIITNKEEIQPTEHVEVPLNFDGFGDSAIKMDGYRELVLNQPIQYGGFKLFYQNDEPLLEPEEVLELDPSPAVINYQ